jgi:hypothetical protein
LGEEVQVQKAEIFLAFWCAQKRSLPRANFPIGEVILPFSKKKFQVDESKVFFCMMQMVYKEFKSLPY